MKTITLLRCIGSTEPSTFGEICGALGRDKPEDSGEWRDFFRTFDKAEREGLVNVARTNGKIDSAVLTEAGADIVRKGGTDV